MSNARRRLLALRIRAAAGLADELMFRWGAVGHDGAQAVAAPVVRLGDVSARYSLAASQFTNIDASRIVGHGKPPSGAHSDIVHPELAWAMLTAARPYLSLARARPRARS